MTQQERINKLVSEAREKAEKHMCYDSETLNEHKCGKSVMSLCDAIEHQQRVIEKATQIINLTHPDLSNVEMNTLTTMQYITWKKELEASGQAILGALKNPSDGRCMEIGGLRSALTAERARSERLVDALKATIGVTCIDVSKAWQEDGSIGHTDVFQAGAMWMIIRIEKTLKEHAKGEK